MARIRLELPMIVALAACGGSAESAPGGQEAGEADRVAADGGGRADAGRRAQSQSAASADRGWSLVVETNALGVDLPPIQGTSIMVQSLGYQFQVLGQNPSDLKIVLGAISEPGDYSPSLFTAAWDSPDYRCAGAGEEMVVSLESLDPAVGTFSGLVRCHPDGDPSEKGEVAVSGSFRD